MDIKSKGWFGRLFCKHDFQPYAKKSEFQNLRGERIYNICTKCAKEGHSVFREYEGNGFK